MSDRNIGHIEGSFSVAMSLAHCSKKGLKTVLYYGQSKCNRVLTENNLNVMCKLIYKTSFSQFNEH